MKNSNIVVIGFMGSGKTTLGKRLASKIKYKFVDMDKYIEKKEKMSVAEIFEAKGEDYFRRLETEVSEEMSKKEKYVIATGGGVVNNPENMKFLCENSTILYLKSTPEHIYRNIGKDKKRPLLQVNNKMEVIRTLMKERTPVYEKYAQVTINVSTGAVKYIISRIIRGLEGKI